MPKIVKVEPTEKENEFLVTFETGGQVIVCAASAKAAYFYKTEK